MIHQVMTVVVIVQVEVWVAEVALHLVDHHTPVGVVDLETVGALVVWVAVAALHHHHMQQVGVVVLVHHKWVLHTVVVVVFVNFVSWEL